MKILISLLLLAACRPSKQMQVFQPDLHKITDSGVMTNHSPFPMFAPVGTLTLNVTAETSVAEKVDTIHEVLFLTTRVPGIAFTRVGQAIQKNGVCIAHLDCAGHLLKPPVYVWSCETEKKRREGR